MIFKKLTMRNILGIGYNTVTIDLNINGLVGIVGKNGVGKSTILDAISYALDGTSHRKDLTIPNMINRASKKDMLVTLELDDWKIVRGEKPKLLQIYKEGNLIDNLSSLKLMNEYIVKNIIKQDKDMILQSILIGVSNYRPILEFSTPLRREFFENIFDLAILSYMKDISSKYLSSYVKEKNELAIKINGKINEINIYNAMMNDSLNKKKDKIKETEDKITETLSQIKEYEAFIRNSGHDDIAYKELIANINKVNLNLTLTNNQLTKSKYDNKRLTSDIANLQNKTCSACGQTINIDQFRDQLVTLKSEKNILEQKLDELQNSIAQFTLEYEELTKTRNKLDLVKNDIDKHHMNIQYNNKLIGSLKKDLEDLNKVDTSSVDIEELKNELNELKISLSKMEEKIKYLKYMKDDILAGNGYKYFILSKYFPEINKNMNRNIKLYELDCNLSLTDDFNIKITDAVGREISYGNFSEGQKKRLNLAVWDAFMSAANNQKNIRSNLLIFDEILDGSMDIDGKEIFLEVMKKKIESNGITCFIISHGMDNFDKTITVSMKHGFSCYEQNY